ncbi:hypothetical protein HDK90DRAFT_495252 [Phyllosticta capitalensis]|uniref:Uncharacterized protein n=1 Tax=Phyllosticta capitalensis TaxID=121624 RepID=A0ABR1YEW8_9PEZI
MASNDRSGESSSASTVPATSNPPQPTIHAPQSSSETAPQSSRDASAPKAPKEKKKRHRGGKKRRRRQSFAAPPSDNDAHSDAHEAERPSLADVNRHKTASSSFYRLGQNRSNTSLESEALLDHRDQGSLPVRRSSVMQTNFYSPRATLPFNRSSPSHRQPPSYPFPLRRADTGGRSKNSWTGRVEEEIEEDSVDDRTPLIRRNSPKFGSNGFGGIASSSPGLRFSERPRRKSTTSRESDSIKKRPGSRPGPNQLRMLQGDDYDINNPPSVPTSPNLEPDMGFDDVMLTGDLDRQMSRDSDHRPNRDILIDIDEDTNNCYHSDHSPTDAHRPSVEHPAEKDVCFPADLMSEFGREEYAHYTENAPRGRRRRKKPWPNLNVLEEWAAEEKEQRSIEGIRARKVNEPLLVDGRLRPQKRVWHREDDDAPFRFTYFNEEFQSTLHSHTLSELLQEGQTFRDLFIPEPPVLSSDSESDDEPEPLSKVPSQVMGGDRRLHSPAGESLRRQSSRLSNHKPHLSGDQTGQTTPNQSITPQQKAKRVGARPVFWLDVMSPTEAEMKALTRTFGIHPLTHEDIMMQEAREKVELFHNYYFVNYRTFEQDSNSEDFMEPMNIYFIIFREGVISVHFSMTPHMANVRRRIRQLSDYLILSSDWIAYAIIDDITDAYAPLIQSIEDEVDEIDDAILRLHNPEETTLNKPKGIKSKEDMEKAPEVGDISTGNSGGNMLRRVGETRKKVMALYRLLGNKADVIKGFAKRCNEQWEVAPKTEIGLYLGDIQDHIVTMTGNLSHYESLLSRAHGNYLAQINIRMNERAEQTNDVLGKLTVLGTIVLPMNIVTGMWGMNVLVPGQDGDNLWWFWGITAFLVLFGVSCFFICKRYYKIV